MRDPLIIAGSLIAAIVIGGSLYLFGSPMFRASQTSGPSGIAFSTLAEGSYAAGVDTQANYRIKNAEELATLWQMIYTNNGPSVPLVDFEREEVLAVFDGSHATGGYGVKVTDIEDTGGKRVIHIRRQAPGEGCSTSGNLTSPFQIVQVAKSVLPLTHVDETVATPCS